MFIQIEMKDITLFKSPETIFLKKISSKDEISLDSDGFLLETSEKESRRIIDSLKGKGKIIAVLGKDDVYNRRALETLKINYLVSPELTSGKDTLKQRDSGLNHVTAKIARDKGIEILIDFTDLSKLKGKEKSRRLARIIQNIKICRRTKTNLKIVTFARNKSQLRDKIQLESFLYSLGMSSQQVTSAFL